MSTEWPIWGNRLRSCQAPSCSYTAPHTTRISAPLAARIIHDVRTGCRGRTVTMLLTYLSSIFSSQPYQRPALQPRRFTIASRAVGCKRGLGGVGCGPGTRVTHSATLEPRCSDAMAGDVTHGSTRAIHRGLPARHVRRRGVGATLRHQSEDRLQMDR